VIAATPEVVIEHNPDRICLEISALQGTRFEQDIHELILQLMTHPMNQRQREAMLATVQKL
jgi:hypothetical protein